MTWSKIIIAEIIIAYLLDLALGDPEGYPHPVRLIGRAITYLEDKLRARFRWRRAEISAGLFLTTVIVGGTFFIVWFIRDVADTIHPYLGVIVSILILYTTLATKNLAQSTGAVYKALEKGDIESARNLVGRIVGRDTEKLPESEIVRAAVETIAENIVDGIVSPLFYAFLGGAPLAMAYKAVNTLDSMIGYRNQLYINFGMASAKLDDWANYIPARITGLLLPLAAWLAGYEAWRSWRIMLRDHRRHPSPNGGIPESAMAGALGIRLGGVNYYGGIEERRSYMGDEMRPLDICCIKDAIRIMYVISFLALFLGIVIITVLGI